MAWAVFCFIFYWFYFLMLIFYWIIFLLVFILLFPLSFWCTWQGILQRRSCSLCKNPDLSLPFCHFLSGCSSQGSQQRKSCSECIFLCPTQAWMISMSLFWISERMLALLSFQFPSLSMLFSFYWVMAFHKALDCAFGFFFSDFF